MPNQTLPNPKFIGADGEASYPEEGILEDDWKV